MNDAAQIPHAGVHFPPPLLYVAGLILGLGLNRWQPFSMTDGESLGRTLAAAACLGAYVALFLGAFAAFRRARTTLIPNRPAATLVTGGPYRVTRNPMYVSLIVLYVGLTVYANSWWPVIVLPVIVLIVDRAVIAREERYLAAAFPDAYGAYRARVRRWL